MTPAQRRRRLDLALVKDEDFLAADLPVTTTPGFRFDAILEFGYLSDYWTVEKARIYGRDPERGLPKVEADAEKVGLHIKTQACRVGYVIVFEECDWRFEEAYAAEAEERHGCRVRFIRSY